MPSTKDFIEALGEFAGKPSAIIYVGIIVLLAIPEWKSPSVSFSETTQAIVLLIKSFIAVTIFNSIYFWFYKKYLVKGKMNNN